MEGDIDYVATEKWIHYEFPTQGYLVQISLKNIWCCGRPYL